MDYPSAEKKIQHIGTPDLQLPVPCNLLSQIQEEGADAANRPGPEGAVPRNS